MTGPKPTYSVKLPLMANCETCDWYREGKAARRQAAQHFAETNGSHYIRLNQDTTTVWEPERYRISAEPVPAHGAGGEG